MANSKNWYNQAVFEYTGKKWKRFNVNSGEGNFLVGGAQEKMGKPAFSN